MKSLDVSMFPKMHGFHKLCPELEIKTDPVYFLIYNLGCKYAEFKVTLILFI